MHEVLVNRLGGLSLPRKSVVRLTDCPDMTLDVYRGHKTTTQQQQHNNQCRNGLKDMPVQMNVKEVSSRVKDVQNAAKSVKDVPMQTE